MTSIHHKRALRISVDLAAIQHNFAIAVANSGGQNLFAVVKADAYGHGSVRVATALEQADGFAVVTLAEAVELRDASIKKPILVLQSARDQHECEAFLHYKLWPVIHCIDQLQWFAQVANRHQLQAWIKIDTGMGRLGFQPDELKKVLSADYGLTWFGALTHFASADEPENRLTERQIRLFNSLTQYMDVQRSLANSAAILAWPGSQAHWARPGIMLYGSNPVRSPLTKKVPLKLAMRVTAPLISLKRYNAGDSIGYAASYRCAAPTRIGYIAIGYGDGLPRVLDRHASVFLNGQICPIVGRASMDTIAIDLSRAPNAKLGDEALLWGIEHPIEILANSANTVSYELMTSIRGPRMYI